MQNQRLHTMGLGGSSFAFEVEETSQKSHKFNGFLGGLSGLIMDTLLHPIDTVRTRIKTNPHQSLGLIQQSKNMFISEGVPSFIRGFSCTLAGSFFANGAYFFTYEKLKYASKKYGLLNENFAPFAAAFAGGIASNIIYLPFIVVRTRMQLALGSYDYKNFFDGAKKVIKYEGSRKLYLGGPIFLTQTALDQSLTFGFYEILKKGLKSLFSVQSESSLSLTVASSIIAASLSAILVNPLDVLVARMQTMHTCVYGPCSIPGMIKRIYMHEGLGGFMKGVTGTMSHYSMAALILFPTYETLKEAFQVNDDI